ncbi:PilZ domain-containing protein [Vibrio mexicanus]|uniref:PilZ domain-containing protein n=1 Tax=Vibrio mexicanus TaxID=1004326 RepID=UPI00063C054D|nr:PilZ domain-containing protein [Vibrio mexicanus]
MNDRTENERQHTRWQYDESERPYDQQSRGLAVEIHETGFFGKRIGRAVVKDISLGGAGILISNQLSIPENIKIIGPDKIRFYAKVVYQRAEGDRFKFVGVTWNDGKNKQRVSLIAKILKQAEKSVTN